MIMIMIMKMNMIMNMNMNMNMKTEKTSSFKIQSHFNTMKDNRQRTTHTWIVEWIKNRLIEDRVVNA